MEASAALRFMIPPQSRCRIISCTELSSKNQFRRESDECFGHEDVMARNFGRDFGSERGGAGLDVAEVAVERREGRAGTDDAEVDGDTAGFAEKVFRGGH